MFGLSPDDIDYARGVLHVRRQVQAINGKLYFALPKGAKTRAVDMPYSVGGEPEFVKEPVAGFLQGAVGCVKQAQEGVEAFVDGVMTDLDESVGVQDQPITRADGEGRGDERDAADPERRGGRQVEQFGVLAAAHQDGGQMACGGDVALRAVRVVDGVDAGGDVVLKP